MACTPWTDTLARCNLSPSGQLSMTHLIPFLGSALLQTSPEAKLGSPACPHSQPRPSPCWPNRAPQPATRSLRQFQPHKLSACNSSETQTEMVLPHLESAHLPSQMGAPVTSTRGCAPGACLGSPGGEGVSPLLLQCTRDQHQTKEHILFLIK